MSAATSRAREPCSARLEKTPSNSRSLLAAAIRSGVLLATAAASAFRRSKSVLGLRGLTSSVIVPGEGTSSISSSSFFAPRIEVTRLIPVRLPPGTLDIAERLHLAVERRPIRRMAEKTHARDLRRFGAGVEWPQCCHGYRADERPARARLPMGYERASLHRGTSHAMFLNREGGKIGRGSSNLPVRCVPPPVRSRNFDRFNRRARILVCERPHMSRPCVIPFQWPNRGARASAARVHGAYRRARARRGARARAPRQ